MAKPKIIEKKVLLQLMAQLRKYYKAETDSEEENAAYEKWQTLCKKAFGDLTLSKRANQLKGLTRDLRDFKNGTVIKVFQALDYVVVDNATDYLRRQKAIRKALEKKGIRNY